MGKHRPSTTGIPAATLIFQNRPDDTDVLPVFHPPHLRRVAPWAAGLAFVGTIATGVVVAPSVVGTAPAHPSAASPILPTLPTEPPTPAEAVHRLAEMAASRSARESDQAAAIEVQAAAEVAAQEAQDVAAAEAVAQEAAEASQALQQLQGPPGGGVPALASITNSAGPVSARVQAAANAVLSDVAGAAGITLGGTRSSAIDPAGHPSGNAVDYMVGSDDALGDAIVAYHIANWDALGVDYIIWQQRYRDSPGGAWDLMEDRGGTTANHYDHPHVNYRA